MEKFIKFIEWLQGLPLPAKVLSTVIVLLICIILLFFSGCGVTRVGVHNSDQNQININTQPSTTVTNSLDSLNFNYGHL